MAQILDMPQLSDTMKIGVLQKWRKNEGDKVSPGEVIAEVAARISRECFDDLDAPVERVGGAEAPMPYAKPLELAALTLEDKIEKAARGLLAECGLLQEA